MRKYTDASQFSHVSVSGMPVPRVILGHLPFVGESYQGIMKNQEYCERFSHVENIVKILKKAVNEYGVTVFANAPAVEGRPAILLDAIKYTIKATSVEMALIPCFMIPLRIGDQPIDDYRRWITYYEIERKIAGKETNEKYVEDPILLCRKGWNERFSKALTQLHPYDKEEIRKMRIDYGRLRDAAQSLEGLKVLFAELGSETDFLAMMGRFDLLEEFSNTLKDYLGCPILLATHHAGVTIPILDRSEVRFEGYLTPVNKLGAMMFPNQELALKEIMKTNKSVIAIKPLAGGRIPPKEALKYVYKEQRADACMIGVGSEKELDEDIQAAKSALEEK